jgi:hypothetical protein
LALAIEPDRSVSRRAAHAAGSVSSRLWIQELSNF